MDGTASTGTRSDGAYVQPHYRSAPDESSMNNYSSWGNINPYTGKEGSAFPPPPPYRPYPAPAYENPYADRNPYDPAR